MSRKKQPTKAAKGTNGQTAKPMSRAEFVQSALARVTEKLSGAARQNLQANYELSYDYPNEYVVFLDDWIGKGRERRLERRLLGHGPREEIKRLSDLVNALPFEDKCRVNFLFVTDPFALEISL